MYLNALTDFLRETFPDPTPGIAPTIDDAFIVSLFGETARRGRHIRAVAARARELAPQLGQGSLFDRNLVDAAYLHDCGYAPAICRTGFHQLDGAVWCAHRGLDTEVVAAVLTHSGAREEAGFDDRVRNIYASLPPFDPPPLSDALTFCDLRTSPDGGRFTIPERLRDIVMRYGPAHQVSLSQAVAKPGLLATQARVLDAVARVSGSLPWVFVDVDNTLIGPGEMPRKRSRHAIRAYVAAGGRVSLATGKHVEAIRLLQDALDLAGPHVAGNGALVVDNDNVHALYHLETRHLDLTSILRRMGIAYIVYTRAGLVSDSPHLTDDLIHRLTRYYESAPIMVSHISPDSQPFKILTYVAEGAEHEGAVRLLAAEAGVTCVRTAPDFLEFLGNEAGKAHGMEWILARAGWPSFHTIAMGDGENDLSMMRLAGRAYAVANASDDVRSVADRVFGSCLEEGFADVLETIVRP